jgi:hypothetical protein
LILACPKAGFGRFSNARAAVIGQPKIPFGNLTLTTIGVWLET